MLDEIDQSSVHFHLGTIQSAIQRMSANSASCKASCITLVSAILVVVSDKEKPSLSLISVIPVVLFLVLDAFYLGLERGFKTAYNTFQQKVSNHQLEPADLYAIKVEGKKTRLLLCATTSFSVWPFYSTLLGMSLAARYLLERTSGT